MKRVPGRFVFAAIGLGLPLVVGCGGAYTTTSSGLQYRDLVEGTGPAAKTDDLIDVHYTGRFRDGREFDSSHNRDRPFTIQLGRTEVIKGWHEGIEGMKPGGKRKLVIPPKLAYGEQGKPPDIPPNTELIFDIELLGIYQLLPGGLYVRDLVEGTGAPVTSGATVELAYTRWDSAGRQLDSNKGRTPSAFKVGDAREMPGMNLGVVGMKVGGTRKLVVPPPLLGPNFREKAAPGDVTIEVELLNIR
jgi:peptidylprolyl isomerase